MRTTYLLAHTGITVLLCLALAQSAAAQIVFTGKSWSQFPGGAKAVCADADIDNDNDGLIEMCYLEDVNAIRHQLDGSGYKSSADADKITTGCKSGGCKGYELVRDLDFNDDDSYINTVNRQTWTKGSGWLPIGKTGFRHFSTILEGNGHEISGLFLPGGGGLLLFVAADARIYNLGLSNVFVNDSYAFVDETLWGQLINCYVSGEREKLSDSGGFFVRTMQGKLTNSYINVLRAASNTNLFTSSNIGVISDSYARGIAGATGRFISTNQGTMGNIYSAMRVRTNNNGVLIDQNLGVINNSYWDRTKWQIIRIADRLIINGGTVTNVRGFDTAKLQASTASTVRTEPYYNWSTDNWDFGTSEEYPAVRHARGDDNNNLACGTSQQPECGSLLRGQRNNQPSITSPLPDTQILVKAGEERTINVAVTDNDVRDTLTILLSKEDDGADIVELVTTNAEVMPGLNREGPEFRIRVREGKMDGQMEKLRLVAQDNSNLENASSDPVLITVTVGEEANIAPVIMVTSAPLPALAPGSTASIVVSIEDINFGVGDEVDVTALSSTPTVASISPAQYTGITANTTRGFTVFANKGGITDIRFSVEDSKGASVSETVQVRVNTSPKVTGAAPTGPVIATVGEEFRLATSDFFSDADGDVLTYQVTGLPNSITMITTDTLSGIPLIGDAMMNNGRFPITVSVSDGKGGNAQVMFTLLIDAKPTGTVSIAFASWQLTATSNIMDDNGIASTSYQWYQDNTLIRSETSDRYSIPNNHSGRAAGTQYYVEATIVDHIGQSVTFTSNVYEVVNEAPTISAITQIGVNEGETVSINPTIADANRDSLTYSWSVTSGDTSPSILADVATNKASLSFEVPPDWIADTVTDNAQRTLQIQLTVSDGSLSAMRSASVVVTKINNGAINPGIDLVNNSPREFSLEVVLSTDVDGENNSPGLSYQWQQCLGSDTNIDCTIESNWEPISGATQTRYTVPSPPAARDGDQYRVKISYTDGQGYSEEVFSRTRTFNTSGNIMIRAKIFLEGSLQ